MAGDGSAYVNAYNSICLHFTFWECSLLMICKISAAHTGVEIIQWEVAFLSFNMTCPRRVASCFTLYWWYNDILFVYKVSYLINILYIKEGILYIEDI